MKENSNA
ncbi:hypothetical protein D041_0506A, partial [Vibrio parahaemolyticus EKP-008]